MNWQATLPSPVGVTFALVADPSRLGDWLPEVTGPAATAAEVGAVFSLTFGAGPGRQAADGEVIAFEPPWLVGYRLFIGSGITTLRVTCAACPAGSQVHLQQAGDLALAVDLGRLARVLGDGLGSLRAEQRRPQVRLLAVAAIEGTDDSLADEAHRAARVEAERHRNALAARYLLWASRLSPDRHDAQGRLLRAGRLLIEAGHLNQADALRDQMEACEPSPMGLLALSQYDLPAAERLLAGSAAQAGRELPGWETGLHREATAGALAQLVLVYSITLRGSQAVDTAARALALGPKEPDVERMATFSAATGHGVADGPVAALDHLATRLPADPDLVAVGDLSLLALRGILGLQAGRLSTAAADLRTRLGTRWPSRPCRGPPPRTRRRRSTIGPPGSGRS
jgi:hypothetical protein